MASWARPGMKVIFVGGGTQKMSSFPQMTGAPKRRTIYTIRDMKIGNTHPCVGEVVIRLREIVVKPHGAGWEDAWLALSGFRPLVTKTQEQDVELFRHLLNTTKTKERV